jgi:hypothetical protein
MLDFEPNGNARVLSEITDGDERRHEICLPLAITSPVNSSRTLEELRILLFAWRSAEEKTKAASA